jgi:hypothetical protein
MHVLRASVATQPIHQCRCARLQSSNKITFAFAWARFLVLAALAGVFAVVLRAVFEE